MIRLKFFTSLFIFAFLWSNFLSAGPTQLTFTYQVTVTNETGAPEGGVNIKLTGYYSVWEYQSDLGYYEWELRSATNEGSTNASGFVSLTVSVDISEYYPDDYRVEHMMVEMVEPGYSVLFSQNTFSYFTNAAGSFVVCYGADEDQDGIADHYELLLAEKFSPILHAHSWELQQSLSDPCIILNHPSSKLWIYRENEGVIYNNHISSFHTWHYWHWCTFGEGDTQHSFPGIDMRLDIPNEIQHQGAPVGSRPLFYHCYKEDASFYLQYWYFFNCNDVRDQSNVDAYHEGDWEHVSLKLGWNNFMLEPMAINFYQHGGGHTKDPMELMDSVVLHR